MAWNRRLSFQLGDAGHGIVDQRQKRLGDGKRMVRRKKARAKTFRMAKIALVASIHNSRSRRMIPTLSSHFKQH